MKLTIDQAAVALKLSRTRVRQLIGQGRIKATKEAGILWLVDAPSGVPKIKPATGKAGRPRGKV